MEPLAGIYFFGEKGLYCEAGGIDIDRARGKDVRVLAGIGLLYVALEAVGVTCPIRYLTGVSCAGCGMSRAWLALLRLDWAGALAYHPLALLPIPLAALLLFQRRLPRRAVSIGLWSGGALFLAVYLIRLALPGDVVVFAPQTGAVWRLVAAALAKIR